MINIPNRLVASLVDIAWKHRPTRSFRIGLRLYCFGSVLAHSWTISREMARLKQSMFDFVAALGGGVS